MSNREQSKQRDKGAKYFTYKITEGALKMIRAVDFYHTYDCISDFKFFDTEYSGIWLIWVIDRDDGVTTV